MELRPLGRSGLKVSAIGLGGNTFGATVDGDAAAAVVHAALNAGVTFIDTADVYSRGRSEELIGRAIAGCRHDVVLATKVRQPMGPGPYERGLSRRWIMRAIEDSLRRLGTDYVDLYQVHAPDDETPIEETLRALDDLVRAGKVRYLGCSNFAAWEMVRAIGVAEQHGWAPWISLQQRWNILEGLDDETHLRACQRLGIGIIPYTPLASGILTGKYRRGEAPPPGTMAGDVPTMRGRLTDDKLAATRRLEDWAQARGHTSGELAIAWLLAYPQVSTVIVGARRPEQVEENLRAAEWKLTEAERDVAARVAAG